MLAPKYRAMHRTGEKMRANVDAKPPLHVRFVSLTVCRLKRFGGLMIEPKFGSRIASMAVLARAEPREPMLAMSETSAIDAASKRLALALDALEAAVERRHEADRGEEGLVAQLHAFGSDRSQLAADLDAAVARARALESTNREIASRLDVAIGTIREVLEANDQ